jgi:multiple sugar transport system substrate-binding protein
MRTHRLVPIIVALLALIVAGCSQAEPTDEPPVGYPSSAPAVTIDFWYMPYGGPAQDEAVKQETEAFHAAHPNITVRPVRVPWNDALTRLSMATTSGDGPDVAQIGTSWVGGFTALDALRPFTAAELSALGGEEAFTPASWTSTRLQGRAETTAVPWLIDVRALFYRPDVLRRAGLDPAKAFADWASFESTLAAIKKSGGGIAPLVVSGNNDIGMIHNVAPFIWGAGGDLLSADGAEPVIDSPAAVDGVAYYQRLLALYNDPRARTMDLVDVPAAFAEGMGATAMSGSQFVADFQANPDRPGLKAGWATAPIPAGPKGRTGFVGGANLAIWKTSDHAGAAFEWVRFLTGQASQQRFAIGSGMWPARASAVAGTKLATDPAYAAFAQMLTDGRQYPPVQTWVDVETVMAKNLAPLWTATTPLPRHRIKGILTETATAMRTSSEG